MFLGVIGDKAERYLKHKGILPHGAKVFRGSFTIGGMDCNGAIILPMKLNGKITSLQFIHDGEKQKRFLPDGEKGGYLIGKIEMGKPICIAEGFATGASIHEATGYLFSKPVPIEQFEALLKQG